LPKSRKKVLCIGGDNDALIKTEMVEANAKNYQAADPEEEAVRYEVVSRTGHLVMLDVAYEECAEVIMKWPE
jgi:pimeloyl-ACP methyl ester carboxylesterase